MSEYLSYAPKQQDPEAAFEGDRLLDTNDQTGENPYLPSGPDGHEQFHENADHLFKKIDQKLGEAAAKVIHFQETGEPLKQAVKDAFGRKQQPDDPSPLPSEHNVDIEDGSDLHAAQMFFQNLRYPAELEKWEQLTNEQKVEVARGRRNF